MPESGTTVVLTPPRGLTETCEIPARQRAIVNEVLLKELLQRDIAGQKEVPEEVLKKEVLERIEDLYRTLTSYPIISKEESISKEREQNLKAYSDCKAGLHERYAGKYVVIAKGEVQAVGESFDDVKGVAMNANHRFIFKAEPKKKVKGTLRWPMKRK